MPKIQSIKKGSVSFGQYEGRACTNVILGGTLYKDNTVVEKIIDNSVKVASISGDFTANSDIINVVKGLSDIGYKVIYSTDSGDEIGSMLRFKNVIFSILVEIPKEGKTVNFIPHILSYMREKDELRFKITSKEDYDDFVNFQKVKNISLPFKVLEVDVAFKEKFIEIITADIVTNMDRLIIKYI